MKKEGERWRRGDWNENDKGTDRTKKQMFHSCIATKKEGRAALFTLFFLRSKQFSPRSC